MKRDVIDEVIISQVAVEAYKKFAKILAEFLMQKIATPRFIDPKTSVAEAKMKILQENISTEKMYIKGDDLFIECTYHDGFKEVTYKFPIPKGHWDWVA